MKANHLFSVLLSALILFDCGTNKSNDPFSGLNDKQTALAKNKNLSKWGLNGETIQPPEGGTVELTDGECVALGGKVEYHPWCGEIRLKCVIGDRAICIDELTPIKDIPVD